MSPAETILERLQRVQHRGQGQWYASCPTSAHKHGDRSRGLSVKEVSDGRILLHCFFGCDVGDIVEAVGLSLSSLFPAPDGTYHRQTPQRNAHTLPARDALELIRHDTMIVACAAEQLLDGTATDEDVAIVTDAVVRIYRVMGAIHGS